MYRIAILFVFTLFSCENADVFSDSIVKMKVQRIDSNKHFPISLKDQAIKRQKVYIIEDKQKISKVINYLSKLSPSDDSFHGSTVYCRIRFVNEKGRTQILDYNKFQIKIGDQIFDSTLEFRLILSDLVSF